jgi:hypothetical protein
MFTAMLTSLRYESPSHRELSLPTRIVQVRQSSPPTPAPSNPSMRRPRSAPSLAGAFFGAVDFSQCRSTEMARRFTTARGETSLDESNCSVRALRVRLENGVRGIPRDA